MASLLEKVESRRVLIAAVVLYLIAEALDFITSILGMAYLRGSHETSIFLRDPHTLKFLATQALWVKSLHTLIRVVFAIAGPVGGHTVLFAGLPAFLGDDLQPALCRLEQLHHAHSLPLTELCMSHQFYPEMQQFDVRDELDKLLLGCYENAPIAQSVLIRRIQDTHCPCWDAGSGSPNSHCAFCQGEGYKWTEDLQLAYMARNFGGVLNPSTVISRQNEVTDYGLTDENRALAYLRYTAFPHYERYLRPTTPPLTSFTSSKWRTTARWLTPGCARPSGRSDP